MGARNTTRLENRLKRDADRYGIKYVRGVIKDGCERAGVTVSDQTIIITSKLITGGLPYNSIDSKDS